MNHHLFTPLALALSVSAAAAETSKTKVEAELDVGLEYDSTLSVEELDRTADRGDTARLLRGKLNGEWAASKKLNLKGGYSYLGKNYRDNSEFDLAIHQGFADAGYDLGAFTLGASHHYALARLDDEDLLDLNLTSLYVSKLIDDRIFLRLAGNYQDKDFDDRPERSAETTGFDGDVYLFFNQAKSFVSVGVSGDREDARGDEFDYDGLGLKTKVQNKFDLLGKASKVALSYRYSDRDYDHVTPAIGETRQDSRQTTRLEWEVEMLPHLDLVSSVQYGDYDSNLDSVNYSETLAALALRLKL